MARSSHRATPWLGALGPYLWLLPSSAFAQAPAEATFPSDPAPAPTPAPAVNAAAAPAAPTPSAPEPAPAAAVATAPAGPAPVTATSAEQGAHLEEPPIPPPPPTREKSPVPPFSVRVDPLNWILLGQLGFELEVGVTDWLSIETVPLFVVDQTPPWLKLGGGDDRVYQRSAGWGPLAGASLGVNFWPRRVFQGYVIRTGLTNYGLEYETRDASGDEFDRLTHTKRQLYAMLGSVERWGAFTIGGGIGLGYDLNGESRCYAAGTALGTAPEAGDCDELQLLVPQPGGVARVAVTPLTYPWDILARISLGVTID